MPWWGPWVIAAAILAGVCMAAWVWIVADTAPLLSADETADLFRPDKPI